jgi:hypothetical protein
LLYGLKFGNFWMLFTSNGAKYYGELQKNL